MVFKQSPALGCSGGSGGGPAACGLSFWSPHPPERLKHELLRQESPAGDYSPHQLLGAPGWPGSLSCMTSWSAAARTEVPWQCSLLAETCSADTAVVWASISFQDRGEAIVWALLGWGQTTQPSSKSVGAETVGKTHHELLSHPCGFLHHLHQSHSCGRSWHRGSRAAD